MGADRHRETAPARVRAREHDLTALALRAAGSSFEAIGNTIGLSTEGARKAVRRALDARVEEIAERAEEVRAIEAAKLDRAEAAIWPKVLAGDPRPIETFIRLSARRAALLGLDLAREPDAPNAPNVIVIDGRTPAERHSADPGGVVDGSVTEIRALESGEDTT